MSHETPSLSPQEQIKALHAKHMWDFSCDITRFTSVIEPTKLAEGELYEVAWPEKDIDVQDFRLGLVDGRKLAFQVHGRKDSDTEDIFALNGMPAGRVGIMPLGIELRMMKWRIITYDRLGYGRSDLQPGRTVADAAKDVAAIADALGLDSYSVIGRSGGAPHALGCAALNGDAVTRTILLNSAVPLDAFTSPLQSLGETNTRGQALTSKEAYLEICEQVDDLSRDPSSQLQRIAPDLFPEDFAFLQRPRQFARLVLSQVLAVERGVEGWFEDREALWMLPWGLDLSKAKNVTIWGGNKDSLSPRENAEWLHSQIPNSELIIDPDGSHLTTMDLFKVGIALLNVHERIQDQIEN